MRTKTDLENEGVSALKHLGFRMVDRENIYYDEVYSAYFRDILLRKRGINPYMEELVDELVAEIETKTNAHRV